MTDYPTFDIEARDRIRNGLLNYKNAHGIGAPKMARRISEVNLNRPKVGYRTLARFLARQHDPKDHFIAYCDKFLRGLPAAPDPSSELARSLMSFYGMESQDDLVGNYGLFRFSREENEARPEAVVSVVRDSDFFRVTQKDTDANRFFDGVLVVATQNIKIFALKERMTRLPRLYKLTGTGGVALDTADTGGIRTFAIRLERL
jgi:hypothetical protein